MVEAQSSEAVVSEVWRNVVAVAVSRDKVKVNKVVKARISSLIKEVVAEVVEADVSAGATMTSHSAIEIPRSRFVLAGS